MAEVAQIIISLISNLGFPIFIAVILIYFVWQIYQDNKKREEKLYKQIEEIQARESEQDEKFLNGLNNFEKTLTSIDNRLCILETNILQSPLYKDK